MKSKILRCIYIILLVICLLPVNDNALELPDVYSSKVLIYDITDGKILQSKNSTEKTSIASLTKILSTITAIENIDDLDEEVVITSEMLNAVDYRLAKAGLKVGDKVTYRDLLYASIVPSGADATISLAYLISGNITNFVKLMNDKASEIGMNNSHFMNVTGLDEDNHYSTAEDIYKLINYAVKNKDFKKIFSATSYTLTNGLKVKSTYASTFTKLGGDINVVTGGKTGTTGKAGKCFAGTFTSENHEFIIVLMNAKNGTTQNISDLVNLIKFIDDDYNDEEIIKRDSLVETIDVPFSKEDKYEILTDKSITKYLPIDYDKNNVEVKYEELIKVNAFTKKDTNIGKITYLYDGEIIDSSDVYLNREFTLDYVEILLFYKLYIIIFILVLFIIISIFIVIKKKSKRKKKV